MTIFLLILAFTISSLIGYLVASLILLGLEDFNDLLWVRVFLGFGIGYGLTSILSFIWQVLNLSFNIWYMCFEVLLGIGLFAWYRKVAKKYGNNKVLPRLAIWPEKSLLLGFLFFVVILGGMTFLLATNVAPSGMWDAWMVQNRTARFLYVGGEHWVSAFSPLLVSADYPILVSISVARLWRYVGHETIFGPAFFSMTMAMSLFMLLISAINYLREKKTSWLAGLAFSTSSAFWIFAPAQLADIPIAFFFLATIVLMQIFIDKNPSRPSLLILAGAVCGLLVWTKNEGWIFLFAATTGYFLLPTIFKQNKILTKKSILKFISGLLPILAVVLFFKILFTPSHDFIRHQTQGTSLIANLINPGRHFYLLKSFFIQLWDLTPDRSSPFFILFLIAIIFGVRKITLKNMGVSATIITICILLAGEYAVYLITPFELQWQVSSSIHRLVLQIWPMAVFTTLLLINFPSSNNLE